MAEHEHKLNLTNEGTLNVQSLGEPEANSQLLQDEETAQVMSSASNLEDEDEAELEEENEPISFPTDELPDVEEKEDAENLELAKLVFKDMMEK